MYSVPARLHRPVLRAVREPNAFVGLFSQRFTLLTLALPSPFSCAPGYVGNPQERVKCRPYDGEKIQPKSGG